MTVKEKYNSIINEIEEMVRKKHCPAKDIAKDIARSHGMTYRDLATVMGFLTGEHFISYIRSRKYQAAYEYIITSKNLNINKAIAIADVSQQSNLNRVFRQHYGITPGDAFRMKDESRTKPPKYWDEISRDRNMKFYSEVEESDIIYGIDIALYERISQINDLQAIYGLDRDYSIIAVKLSDEYGFNLESAFSYVEGFKAERDLVLGDEEADAEEIASVQDEHWLWNKASDPAMIYCCITCGVSVSSALWMISELPELGHDPITELSPYFIRAFSEGYNIHSHFLRKACEYYESHIDDTYTDEDFEEFIDQLSMNKPIELAFEAMQVEKAWNDDDDIISVDLIHHDVADIEAETAFEAWADQEAGNYGPRFDDEYDPDNP